MQPISSTTSARSLTPPKPRISFWRKLGGGSLTISIIVHAILLAIGVYLIVGIIPAPVEKIVDFTPSGGGGGSPPAANLQNKKQANIAKVDMARVSAKGMTSNLVLPEPEISSNMKEMASLGSGGLGGAGGLGGGTGMGKGLGAGTGTGSGVGPGFGTGKGGLTAFGFREASTGLLTGRFYDLKQDPERKPTKLGTSRDTKIYLDTLSDFINSGWKDSNLDDFYCAPNDLFAGQIYVPIGESSEAPKAFRADKKVDPSFWIVIYRGRITAPDDGNYRFVGLGDNIMAIRLKRDNVFSYAGLRADPGTMTGSKLGFANVNAWELSAGKWFKTRKGDELDIEILIGDFGGNFAYFLMLEKEGETYAERKDAPGKAYPIFQVSKMPVPKSSRYGANGYNPQVAKDAVIFQGIAGNGFPPRK